MKLEDETDELFLKTYARLRPLEFIARFKPNYTIPYINCYAMPITHRHHRVTTLTYLKLYYCKISFKYMH